MERIRFVCLTMALACALSIPLAGCQGPCDSLADKICECELNTAEVAACQEVIRANHRSVTTAEEEECSQRLDTCTCEALEDGDLALCGLAK